MLIELGFQSNCSELVVHLGIVEPKEIITAMKRIARLTGWHWGAKMNIKDSHQYLFLPIPDDQIDSLVRIDENERDWIYDDIVKHWTDSLDDKIIEGLKESDEWDPMHELELFDGPVDEIRMVDLDIGLPVEPDCPGCDEAGLTFQISDDDSEKFPPFHMIRMEFDVHLESHAGSDSAYLEWMMYHFQIDKLSCGWKGEYWGTDKYPPIDPKQKLTLKALNDLDVE